MANATNITYGNYNFQRDAGPVPLLDISITFNRNDAGDVLNTLYKTTLKGEINLLPSGIDGYKNIDERQDLLISGFSQDYQEFKVTCDNNTLIQQYPRINSIAFSPSNDNWSETADYSIELEWDGAPYSGLYLENISENWEFSLDQQNKYYSWNLPGGTGDNNMYLFSLTHTVSAKGLDSKNISNRPAWQEARAWVISRLGYDSSQVTNSGVFNLNAANFSGWNHSRVQKKSEKDGTFEVTETWLVANTGFGSNAGAATEDFTASVSYDISNNLTSVSINGSIQGMEEISYGSSPNSYSVSKSAFTNASGYWQNIRPKLAGRASLIASGVAINPLPMNYNIGYNPTKGTINYTYQFDDRPCNFIPNAIFENITINDTNPVDVFAETVVLGRRNGPVLQRLDTVTSSKRNVNIEIVVPRITQCSSISAAITGKPNINSVLCEIEAQISGNDYFKSQDNESWDFKNGRYTRNVEWTWTNCSGNPPNTSFCS